MQIIIYAEVLALIGALTAVTVFGIVRIERAIARWLLQDARGWAAREQEKKNCAEQIAGVV